MAQKTINTSPNIAVLEGKIVTDLCLGKFFVDLTPTLFLGAGATNVLGAKIKILDQFDTPIKPYTPTYDILPPMTSIFEFLIPKQNGSYQYSTFNISIEITDADGTKYEITQAVKVCQPDIKNKKRNYGQLIAQILGNCKDGKVTVLLNEPPVYNGFLSESRTQSYTLYYPTGTIATPVVTTQSNFQVPLFEGDYRVKGDVCVTYNFGDYNYAKVPYKVDCEKSIKCLVDFCIVFQRMQSIGDQIRKDDCVNKEDLSNVLLSAVSLLETIRLGNDCGQDISTEITELEQLLGVECSCTIADGTPISPVVPAASVVIDGCNVVTVVGVNTTTYTIDNYDFVVTVNPTNNSFLVIAPPSLNGCTKTQQLTFNVGALYTEIKGLANASLEQIVWANIVKGGFVPTAPNLACLGLTSNQYQALDYSGFWNIVIAKMCGCCTNSSPCLSEISNISQTVSGQNTIITWNNSIVTNVPYGVVIYVDGYLIDTLIFPTPITSTFSYVLSGYNNGVSHFVEVIPTCSNGLINKLSKLDIVISNAGCPTILPPTLSSNNISNAACPYNLNSLLLGTVPAGLTIQWEDATNLSQTINPNAVTSGTYRAYYFDNNKCQSPKVQVSVSCATAGNCSEPLNLLIQNGSGSTSVITFSSASTPPPSYLVKRRLASAPDTGGSYTTIGAPTFNAGTNKWEIIDATLSINTLYVYMAESQCSDASRPNTQVQYGRITCPTVTLTNTNNSIGYSFINVGGQVDKYIVELYDSTGNTLIGSNIITPAFASPITGTFTGLTALTAYKVRVKVYIGVINSVCPDISVTTFDNNIFVTNGAKSTVPATTYNIKVNGTTVYTGSFVAIGTIQSYFAGLNITAATVLLTVTSADVISSPLLSTDTGIRGADVLTATTAQWDLVTWPEVQMSFSV